MQSTFNWNYFIRNYEMNKTLVGLSVTVLIVSKIISSHAYGQKFISNLTTYYIDSEQKYTWMESLIACMEMNMTLVTIDSKAKTNELNFIVQHQFGNVKLWIGGIMSRFPNPHFVWVNTGKTFSYTDWHGTNPDFYGNDEYCAHIGWGNNLQWNDNTCTNSQGFVCENKPQQQPTSQLQQELQGEKQKQQILQLQISLGNKKLQDLQQQIHEKETQQINLRQQFEKFKDSAEQENRNLKQDCENLKNKVIEVTKNFENMEERLKIALENQPNLQQELEMHQNLKENFRNELHNSGENQKVFSNTAIKNCRDIHLHFHQNQ